MKLLQTNHINFSDFTILAPEILRMVRSGMSSTLIHDQQVA